MSAPAHPKRDREILLAGGFAACISVASFLIYSRGGNILLYGDAVAHINIARRVFDSRTPGLLQLGTVWLPLPHLLMIPFLLPDWAWRTGVGGSIPSLLAYVAGVPAIFRLVRDALSGQAPPSRGARLAAWFAALVYAMNPNLIYLQTTAMTEPLYLALFLWAVVYFADFTRQVFPPDEAGPIGASQSLMKCGIWLAAASLTRYDGWFAAAAMIVIAAICVLMARGDQRALWRALLRFGLLAIAAPVLWLAYNASIYRNPLEFANGPYSAPAIAQKSIPAGFPPLPGANDPKMAALYFFKSAQLNMGEGKWGGVWAWWLVMGGVALLMLRRRALVLLLLGLPLPFYALSVAHGGVPIFLPVWWPFSYYNVRYGLQMLPALAAAAAMVFHIGMTGRAHWTLRMGVAAGSILLLAGSYASIWSAQPIGFREAWVNSRSRIALEGQLAASVKTLPPDSTILMYLGDHVGALQQAGIPLRRVIHEGNHRAWKQPSDPAGLWERALADPAANADYVVAVEGDPVSIALHGHPLPSVARIEVAGQPPATIYQARPATR